MGRRVEPDTVEVVRCRDCIYYAAILEECDYPTDGDYLGLEVAPGHFCAFGVRRDICKTCE